MSTVEDLRHAVQTARLVTADIDEMDLRRLAFDRVLEHLLATQEGHLAAGPRSVDVIQRLPPREIRLKRATGPSAWVADLHAEGFFKAPKTITKVVDAVKAMGHNILSKDVTYPLEQMARRKVLRREKEITNESKRRVWVYRDY